LTYSSNQLADLVTGQVQMPADADDRGRSRSMTFCESCARLAREVDHVQAKQPRGAAVGCPEKPPVVAPVGGPMTPLAPARNTRVAILVFVDRRELGFFRIQDKNCQQRGRFRAARIFADPMMGASISAQLSPVWKTWTGPSST